MEIDKSKSAVEGLLTDAYLFKNVGIDPIGEHIRATLAGSYRVKNKGSGEVAVVNSVS